MFHDQKLFAPRPQRLRGEISEFLFATPAWQGHNQSRKPYFTTEAQRSQSSECVLIKNFLLCALSVSAVNYNNL
jgi:hypothetical protein